MSDATHEPQSTSSSACGRLDRPQVRIVVVSYNTRDLTLEAIRSAHAETRTPFEMTVVDNASVDGSARAIADAFPDVEVIALDDNVGFAVGNNVGACDADEELLLLLNPDTVVLDGAIDELVAFARRRPAARIWGGRTLFADRSLNPSSCWRRLNLWHAVCRTTGLDTHFPDSPLFNGEAYGGWARDTERNVDIVSGCFFLIETSLWHELGGFDPTFVMYGEEADLCIRAATLGATPCVTPAAQIIHLGGASESVRSQKHVRLLRAKITLARRHLKRPQSTGTTWMIRLWPASRLLAATVLGRLRPSAHMAAARAEWGAVWRQRSEWWTGYPTRTRPAEGERG